MSGYAFTPLPDAPHRAPRPEARFDRRLEGCLFGRIRVGYRAEQPIHVGAGHKVLLDGVPTRAQMKSGASPIAPGSTWKGVIRARFEAISRSCAGKPPPSQKRLVSQSFPDYSAELSAAAAHHPVFSSCQTRAGELDPNLCPACALFGAMDRRARVAFTDLISDATEVSCTMPEQFSPRLHHLAERDGFDVDDHRRRITVRRLRGRKFHGGKGPASNGPPLVVRAIPAGAMLTGAVTLFNIRPAELGGLLVALGVAPSSYVELGAGKSHDFGRLAPRTASPDLCDHRGRPVALDLDAYGAAWRDSDDRWAEGEDALRAIHNRGDW